MKRTTLLFAFPALVLAAVIGCSDDEEPVNTPVGGAAGTAQGGSASGGSPTGGATQGGSTQTQVTVQGGAAGQGGSSSLAGHAGLAGQTGAGQPGSNFGTVCYSDADCAGKAAPLCLKPGATPAATDPGVCTIVNCTSEICGDLFNCCNCASSAILATRYTTPTCFPLSGAVTVSGLGCTCT